MQGRSGPTTNPEMFIAIITGSTGILLAGQLIPTLCIFRRPVIWMCGFLLVFLIFLILMATPLGFPYREELSQQRFWIFVSKLLNSSRILIGIGVNLAHGTTVLQFRQIS